MQARADEAKRQMAEKALREQARESRGPLGDSGVSGFLTDKKLFMVWIESSGTQAQSLEALAFLGQETVGILSEVLGSIGLSHPPSLKAGSARSL